MAVERIGVSLEGPLLTDFDRFVTKEGYGSRSEALRNLIREALTRRRFAAGGHVVGTSTLGYLHHGGGGPPSRRHPPHDAPLLFRPTAPTHPPHRTRFWGPR